MDPAPEHDDSPGAHRSQVFAAPAGSPLTAALTAAQAATELRAVAELDEMLRVAVRLARERIGLERVALYMREPRAERLIMRGTWGTGAGGETTDEHFLSHEVSAGDALSLRGLRAARRCGTYRSRAPWFAFDRNRPSVLGEGWIMVTPLVYGDDLVGVMYNDAALTGSCVNPDKQVAAAVFAEAVAMEYAARSGFVRWHRVGGASATSPFVQRIRDALDQNLAVRGKDLAVQFGVSPGHLARAFKRDMGMSLVEYRNRKRLDRFWQTLQDHGSRYTLKQAAALAEFGSYAQFNRIYKKVLGVAPQRNRPLVRQT